MSLGNEEQTYRELIAAVGGGDEARLDGLLTPDVVDYNALPGQPPGREGLKWWVAAARAAFPDLHGTVEEVVPGVGRLAARVTWRGTHRGEFAGLPPTGRRVSFSAFHLVHFEGERISRWWGSPDAFGLLAQLGGRIVPG